MACNLGEEARHEIRPLDAQLNLPVRDFSGTIRAFTRTSMKQLRGQVSGSCTSLNICMFLRKMPLQGKNQPSPIPCTTLAYRALRDDCRMLGNGNTGEWGISDFVLILLPSTVLGSQKMLNNGWSTK